MKSPRPSENNVLKVYEILQMRKFQNMNNKIIHTEPLGNCTLTF